MYISDATNSQNQYQIDHHPVIAQFEKVSHLYKDVWEPSLPSPVVEIAPGQLRVARLSLRIMYWYLCRHHYLLKEEDYKARCQNAIQRMLSPLFELESHRSYEIDRLNEIGAGVEANKLIHHPAFHKPEEIAFEERAYDDAEDDEISF